MDKKVGKKEILLLLIIFAAAVIGYFVFQKLQSTPGAQVKVTVDGTVYGTYDLHTTGEKAKKIQIKNAEGTVTNTLVIENGKADMISADCPDKLCVNQHAISSNGETIVCLPNKVVVEVEDGEEAQFHGLLPAFYSSYCLPHVLRCRFGRHWDYPSLHEAQNVRK